MGGILVFWNGLEEIENHVATCMTSSRQSFETWSNFYFLYVKYVPVRYPFGLSASRSGLARLAALHDHKRATSSHPLPLLHYYLFLCLYPPFVAPFFPHSVGCAAPWILRPGQASSLRPQTASLPRSGPSLPHSAALPRVAHDACLLSLVRSPPSMRPASLDILAPSGIADVAEMVQLPPTALSLPLQRQGSGSPLGQSPSFFSSIFLLSLTLTLRILLFCQHGPLTIYDPVPRHACETSDNTEWMNTR
jgi:hypothetical protein